jgi:CheY-like chemotaxis protein
MTAPESTSKDQVRILVVDDHPNTAATLARALSQLGAGVNVISASSGRDALEKVKTIGVDILFTDMIMPEMTGLELIEKMQNHPAGRPAYTYLVTAYDVPGLKVTAHRLKVNEVIVKPVRPERICQIATNAIEEMKQTTRPVKIVTAGKKKFKILVADDMPDNVICNMKAMKQ